MANFEILKATFLQYGKQVADEYRAQISHCNTVCAKSYNMLTPKERKHIDELFELVPELYLTVIAYLPHISARAQKMDVTEGTKLIKMITKVLKNKNTRHLISHYMHLYGDLVTDSKRMKAYGMYIKCVLSHIDAKYKVLALAVIDMAFAATELSLTGKDLELAKHFFHTVNAYIVKPVYSEIKKAKRT